MARDYAKSSRSGASEKRGARQAPGRKRSQPGRKAAARKAPVSRRGQSGGLSLKWILSLAAVGGFVGFIAYLNSLPDPQQAPARAGDGPSEERQVPQVQAPGTDSEKPGFRFYDILPESEVVAPEVEEYTPGKIDTGARHLLQTGSFRKQEDAERQRAEIAFQGLRASVQDIRIDGDSTWFRVNVGPFESRSEMNAAIDKLVGINIQPLVRQVPKEN